MKARLIPHPFRRGIARAMALSVLALAVSLVGIGVPVHAAPTFTDAGFASETLATLPPFTPVGLAFAPDGRIFVWQKSGIVRIIKDGVLLPIPFIDIQSQVNQYVDRGFLGLAIDPNLSATGYVYLLYTHEPGDNSNDSGPKMSRLTRVTADPANADRALAGSEVVILDNLPSDDSSHSIGTVRFAPDGNLFVGVGDGASFNFVDDKALRAQDLNSVNGKILRVTTSGAALSDNPFYDGTNSIRSKVWAYGLRNPFRFGLHPSTGEPMIGDVGWNNWEELNRGRGANFGWPCYEGNLPHDQYQSAFSQCQALSPSQVTSPLYSYSHAGSSSAVVGGAYYSATQYPTVYRDNFFFGDYSQDWIRRAVFDAGNNLVSVQPFASNVGGPVAIELGPDGLLYYVSIITGEIGRIGFNGPLAKASAAPTTGYSPLTVNFSSAGSIDPGGGTLTYAWAFGDGGTSTSANPSHTYTVAGVATYTATLTVRDSGGRTSTDRVQITVGSRPPTASITSPSTGTNVTVGSTVTFQGSGTDPDDGALSPSALSWTVLLHHDSHVHPLITASGSSGSFTVVNYGTGTYSYEIMLTATDSSGLIDTRSVVLPVVPSAFFDLAPSTIQLTGASGGATVSQTVTVTNAGNTGSTLNWTATVNQPWLTVTPGTGTAPGSLTVNASPASLGAGTFTGAVTLSAPGTSNSPAVIPVTLMVVTAGSAPTVTAVTPSTGNPGQTLSVVITGTNFASGATCGFGAGITVTACTLGSATQLTASVSIAAGATPGSRTVTVVNPDGQNGSLASAFTITSGGGAPAPTVTGANPATGTPGQSVSVVITGTNFASGATCGFGAGITVTACTLGSATQLTASVSIAAGATLGPRTITVTNPDAQSGTLPNGFSVVAGSSGSGRWNFSYADRTALLADGWDFLARPAAGGSRNTEQGGALAVNYDQASHPGTIRIPVGAGEIWQGLNDSENTLFRDLPSDWTSIRLKIGAFSPVANYQQVGLLAYQNDDTYVNLNRAYINGGQVELFREQGQSTALASRQALSNTGNLILRLDRNASTNTYTGYYSTNDGATWTTVGSTTATLVSPRVGVQVGANLAGTTPVADLAWVEVVRPVAVSPESLGFSAVQSGANPAAQVLSVIDGSGGAMNWTASDNQPWLSLSPTSGSGSGSITVTVSTSGLAAGTYSGTITVTPSGTLNSPKTMTVALTVTAAPSLSLSLASLGFSGVQGGPAPGAQTLTVANTGGGVMTWGASVNQPWLSISQDSGTALSSVSVNASTAGLVAGTYSATITVTAPGATNSPRSVGVTLVVDSPAPGLRASPISLSFGAVQGGVNPEPQNVAVSNIAPGNLNWSAVSNQPWMTVAPASGNTSGGFAVSVSTAGMAPGSYAGAVTVTSDGASNSPLAVPVTVTVISGQPGRMSLAYGSRAALVADGWDFFARTASGAPRNTEQTAGLVVDYNQTVHPGTLRIPADQGTPWSTSNDARNAVFRDLPADWQSIRLKVAAFAPTGVYQSACLAAYQNDDNYVALCRDFVNAQWVEWWQETSASPSVLGNVTNAATTNMVLRLDRNPTTNLITAFVSSDGGGSWAQLPGSVVKSLAAPRLGIMVGGNASASVPNADLEFVEVVSPPALGTSPGSLAFGGATAGPDPGSQIFAITNTGAGELTWSASANQSWISVTPTTGTAPGIVSVKVSTAGLSAGIHNATITVTSPQATNSPRSIPVTLTLALPALATSPTGLDFAATVGANPPSTILSLTNVAGGPLAWTATVDQPWLSLSLTSGTTPGSVSVAVSSAGLAAGTYNATITVASGEATNSPLVVPVSLVVSPPAQTTTIDLAYGSRAALVADGWDFFARTASGAPRNTEQTAGLVVDYNQTVHPGTLRIPADQGTPWSTSNDARNAVFRDLPADWQSIRLKVAAFAPTGVYQSACLAAYQNDDNYVALCRDFVNAQWVEWWQETSASPSVLGNVTNAATTNMVLRLDRNPTTNLITAFVSSDGGGSWAQLPGSVVKSLAAPRLGIMVGGNASASVPNADLDFVEIVAVPPVPAPPAFALSPRSLSFNAIAGSGNPATQSVTVGGSGFTWNASVDQSWLSISPTSGPASGSLTVGVSASGLAAGTYSGTVTLTSAGASNSPQGVPVTLTIGSLLDRRVITAVVLVNGTDPSGYNPSPSAPGEFQRYPERYLEHLQVPYEIIDVSTASPPADLFDRQLIISGHRALNLNRIWQDAVTNAVVRGTGFVNLDWDPAVGAQSHIQTVFGATGAVAGAPGQAITVPASIVPGGTAPHYIAALQRRFLGDSAGDITYVFHPDAQDVQQSVRSTVLTGASGTVIARIGDDPLIIATAYGAGRAVHVGSLEYLKADRFGFLQGVDDLFWRSVVWAARKPFIVRGYPKLWSVQMDDTTPNWGSRVRDLYDQAFTGPVSSMGTGGPWKVTGYVYTQHLLPGSTERGSVRSDIDAGYLEVAPHSFFGTAFGDIYWNGESGALTDAQWTSNVNDTLSWAQGSGGSDALPLSRSVVAHYWDLSNNTGWDLWNRLGFRYVTSIQKPGFQRLTEYGGQERLSARPFWVYEKPPKLVPDENHPFFFADDITVGSRAGLPAQNMFLFTTQVQGIGAPRPDVTWPDVTSPAGTWSVAQSVNQFQLYTWRLWSSMAPVQIFTHDSVNYELSTVSNRQTVIRDVSTWLNANGVRHRFMDDFGDYVHARTKSSLNRSELTGGNMTHTFSGNSATAEGTLIGTDLQLYMADDEGTAVSIPGFTGGRLITLPVGGP